MLFFERIYFQDNSIIFDLYYIILKFRLKSLNEMMSRKKKNSSEIYSKETSLVKRHCKGNYWAGFFILIPTDFQKYIQNFPISEEKRTANIVADDLEGVSCLVIDRESFHQLISNLDDIKNKYIDLTQRKAM